MSRETITAAFATCRQAGLGTLSYNMVGLPGEGPRETVSSPPPLFSLPPSNCFYCRCTQQRSWLP